MDLPIRKPSRWQNRVRPMWCLIDRIISFRPEISTGIASAPSKTCSWILLTSCLLATSLRAQQPVEPVAPITSSIKFQISRRMPTPGRLLVL
jgi:hypothetical protein